jgi:hypothetical protein
MFKKIAQWFTRFGRVERSESGAGPNGVDCAEVQRLRAAGVSWRKIAKMLPGQPAQSTVRYQFDRWLQTRPVEPEVSSMAVAPEPPAIALPAALLNGLNSLIAMPSAPRQNVPEAAGKPSALPVEPEIESDVPLGLDSLKPGKAFFLVTDDDTARQAHGYGQAALAFDSWDVDSLAELPAVQATTKIYVLIEPQPFGPDEARWLRTLDHSKLRDRVWVAQTRDVQPVFERRRELREKYGDSTGDFFWQETFRFAPLGDVMRLVPQAALPEPQQPQFNGLTSVRVRASYELQPEPSPLDGRIQ